MNILYQTGQNNRLTVFRCKCGTVSKRLTDYINRGLVVACVSCEHGNINLEAILGKFVYDWQILKFDRVQKNGVGRWLCKCNCGTIKSVRMDRLFLGLSKSCGCRGYKPGKAGFLQLYSKYKLLSQKINREFKLSKEKFEELTSKNCYYCGNPPMAINYHCKNGRLRSRGGYRYNGIDRVDNSIGYLENNCVTCCIICNRAKHAGTQEKYLNWIKSLIINYKNNSIDAFRVSHV